MLVLLQLFVLLTWAEGPRTADKAHLTQVKDRLKITVDKGYHFNVQAPNKIQVEGRSFPPVALTEAQIDFPIPAKAKGNAKVEYYVCDDAKTFCEPHTKEFAIESTGKQPAKKSDVAPRIGGVSAQTKGAAADRFGDDFSAALIAAKAKKQFVFVDFTASWCPPCIRLEHETFSTQAFKEASKNFELVRVDVDRAANADLLKRYHVRAFPTLVIVDGDGEERARILDFLPATEMAKRLTAIQKDQPASLTSLKTKAQSGDATAATQLADYYSKSLQPDLAVEWYQKSKVVSENSFDAFIAAAEKKANDDPKNMALKTAHQTALQNAITGLPESFRSIFWRKDLAGQLGDGKAAQKLNEEALALISKWLNEPARISEAHKQGQLLELEGLVRPELWAAAAEIHQNLKQDAKAKTAWENAIAETMKLNPSVQSPTPVIYLTYYMKQVRPTAEVEKWFVDLQKTYPDEYTYYQRHANLLFEKKEYARALPLAQIALDKSYETNRLRVGLLMAKIQNALKNKDQATATLKAMLDSPAAKTESNRRMAKTLTDYLTEVQTK